MIMFVLLLMRLIRLHYPKDDRYLALREMNKFLSSITLFNLYNSWFKRFSSIIFSSMLKQFSKELKFLNSVYLFTIK